MSTIIVNATAARKGGAISILTQFLSNIPCDTLDKYIVFVNPCFNVVHKTNIEYVHVNTVKWVQRYFWDRFGLYHWVKRNGMKVDLIISFQNTGVFFDKNVPQLIYYHQLLPLSNHKWNPLKRDELLCFLYSRIYPFFVRKYIRDNTFFAVQTQPIKECFAERFDFDSHRILVVSPQIEISAESAIIDSHSTNEIDFIYPADYFPYKNHIVLVEALRKIRKLRPELLNRIRVHLTLDLNSGSSFYRKVKDAGLEDNFLFHGMLAHKMLLKEYNKMDALLFPSFIETIGLPLLEAAGAGIAILVSDLPYAKHVISKYEGACFIKYDEPEAWAFRIIQMTDDGFKKFPPYHYEINQDGWNSFFKTINKLK